MKAFCSVTVGILKFKKYAWVTLPKSTNLKKINTKLKIMEYAQLFAEFYNIKIKRSVACVAILANNIGSLTNDL